METQTNGGEASGVSVAKNFLFMHLRAYSELQEPALAYVWQRVQGVLQDLFSPSYIVVDFSGRHMVI